MPYVLLIASFGLLLVGAIGFTNAVEWAGYELGLGSGAVGSILAAVATALPESTIPIVAVIAGEESAPIAIGAILGAPLLLSTLAMALIGMAAVGFRKRRRQGHGLDVHRATTSRDLGVFLGVMTAALVVGVIGNRLLNVVAAVLLVVTYVVYAWRTVRSGGGVSSEENLSPLYIDPTKRDPPAAWQTAVQMVAGVAMIVGGAQVFVTVIEHLATRLGVSSLILALVIAPLATELPEKTNSLIWTRAGKDELALGNITGAMVFQTTIPVAFGMAFTPWQLGAPELAAGSCSLAGAGLTLWALHRRGRFAVPALAGWGVLYGGFVLVALVAS